MGDWQEREGRWKGPGRACGAGGAGAIWGGGSSPARKPSSALLSTELVPLLAAELHNQHGLRESKLLLLRHGHGEMPAQVMPGRGRELLRGSALGSHPVPEVLVVQGFLVQRAPNKRHLRWLWQRNWRLLAGCNASRCFFPVPHQLHQTRSHPGHQMKDVRGPCSQCWALAQ